MESFTFEARTRGPDHLLAAECSPLSSIRVRDHVCPLAHSHAHRAEQSPQTGAGFGQRLAQAVHLAVQSCGGRSDGDYLHTPTAAAWELHSRPAPTVLPPPHT